MFLRMKVSSGNAWDVRRYYWDWKSNKKVFFQLKLVWPNDQDGSYVSVIVLLFPKHEFMAWFSSFYIRFPQIYQSSANTETRNTLKTLTVAASVSFNIYTHLTLALCNIIFACRSSHLQMFFKLGALKISANFTKNTCVKDSF